jgi:hypothetical protein
MAQVCPLAFRQIDGTIARLNTITVSFVLVLFLITAEPLWLLFLAIDFMVRLYGHKPYSPVYLISSGLKKLFGLQTVMVDAGAKRLAGHFGLAFVLITLGAALLQLSLLMYAAAAVFLSCLMLELAFGYCIGCKIYFLYRKLMPVNS